MIDEIFLLNGPYKGFTDGTKGIGRVRKKCMEEVEDKEDKMWRRKTPDRMDFNYQICSNVK